MKKFFIVGVLVFLLGMQSCETEKNVKAVYIIDCTGDYLRVDGKDYYICNFERFSGILDGTEVTAFFSFVDECYVSRSDCYLYHQVDDWIEIKNMYQ